VRAFFHFLLERTGERPPPTLFNPEQHRPRPLDTIVGMYRKHLKTAIVAGWILGLGAIASSMTLGSAGGWTLLLGWGLLPPLLLIRLRKQQELTISESIREAIR
jgi:hypothetical protein